MKSICLQIISHLVICTLTIQALSAQSTVKILPRMRVIVDNDFSGDPDGLFQLAHIILSPSVEVRGIIGSHLKVSDGFDNSTNQAENAVRKANTLLSIIPGGTANLLAQALKIPNDVEKAAEIAIRGRDRLIDLGQCGDQFFALGLGMGLTEKLVSGTSSKEKERLGRLAYAKAMLAEMGQKPSRFSFRLDDGEKMKAAGVALVVANAGEISGKWKFAPDAEMDDGLLDLCILHRFYFRDLIRFLVRGLLGNLQEDRAITFFQAKSIRIESEPPLDLQIDGEEVETKPP
ncbi:MAG: hypothetical protein EOP04_25845, partial [Proteobacteria bacterium]